MVRLLLATAVTVGVAQAALYNISNVNHTCQIKSLVRSCSANAVFGGPGIDSCCTETYGGLILSTQFWSTYTGLESRGQKLPASTWTLHGLWPDFCNRSYTQYCDLSRQYDPTPSPNTTNSLPNGTVVPPYNGSNIGTFVSAFGRNDLLAWMNTYWINQGAPNSDFWGHEFSKHATCFSTFDIPCYGPKYVQHQDVIDFFQTAILYYQRLPTWGWLSAAGIRPSNTTNYNFTAIQTALRRGYGATPYIGCTGPRYNETTAGRGSNDTGRTVLSEVWYYSNVLGRVQLGISLPVNATGSVTSCALSSNGVQYPTRSNGSVNSNPSIPIM